jgi:outer membrane murein-binding lipoprotein Lpp
MLKQKKLFFVLCMAFMFSVALVLSGCSSEASVEQLQKIKELEAEKASLEQTIRTKETEKAALEATFNTLSSKLDDCNQEQEVVKKRLESWKEPIPEPVKTTKTTKKK